MLRKERPHVVIVGGGFAGLAAAKALANRDVRVTLIDKHNHHLFQPLLYQVATAALAAPDIASPLRKIFRDDENVTTLMGDVVRVVPRENRVDLREGMVSYDYLIIAVGMRTSYFGHDEWARHTIGLKTLEDALAIRRVVLSAFEKAERRRVLEGQSDAVTIAVIGGGATGVELAGAVAEIAGRTLARDFRAMDPTRTKVVLIEAGDRLLPTMHEKSSEHALTSLREMGVDVRLQTRVTAIDANAVTCSSANATEVLQVSATLWAAGLRANSITDSVSAHRDKLGRVQTLPDLRTQEHSNVFVTGDVVAMEQENQALPGVAQMAIQSGRHAAHNVLRLVAGEASENFWYDDKGTMATIGRARAVAEAGTLRFDGLLAWLMWLFVHVMALVGFRNRLAVLGEWTWAYLSWQRSARVILEGDHESVHDERGPL